MITRLLLLVGFSSAIPAQSPRSMFPWWEMINMRDIGLNEEQSAKVRSILKETRINLIDARASLEKAEAEVEDIFNDDAVDIRKGNEAIERLVKARTDHGRAISQLSLRLRAVLSAR